MNLFDNKKLRWKRFVGGDQFDYPIDYSAALLQAYDDGHVDLLYWWAPNAYCHFHRHTARTTSTVLAGELHVIDIDPETGEETQRRIRKAGTMRARNLATSTESLEARKARLCCSISLIRKDCWPKA